MATPVTATPQLTVAVCTLNRAADLDRALLSLRAEAEARNLAVIVVDNGSTDRTAEVTARAKADLPGLIALLEPVAGLSAARNRALAACTTPLIAFIDDDATAEPGWAAAIEQAFERQGPDTAAVGGRIIPDWEVPPPAWITPVLATYYSALDLGPGTLRLDAPRIFGANMAFRTHALRTVGGFSLRLGRVGSSLLGNEELATLLALKRLGYALAYCGAAAVLHRVPASRMTRDWLEARIEAQGRSDARLFTRVNPAPRATARAGLTALKDLVRNRGLDRRLAAAYARGFVLGLLKA